MIFPYLGQFYLEPEATFNNWDFFQGNDIIAKKFSPTVLDRVDRKYGLRVGIPIAKQVKAFLQGAYFVNNDQYIDKNVLVSTDTLDQLELSGLRFGFGAVFNSMNRKQYPSQGKAYSISGNYFSLLEEYKPGNTSVNRLSARTNRSWIQAKITLEQYFKKGIYSSVTYWKACFQISQRFQIILVQSLTLRHLIHCRIAAHYCSRTSEPSITWQADGEMYFLSAETLISGWKDTCSNPCKR